MTYYKVVTTQLRSCCANPFFPEEYRVQYKVNEFVVPRIARTKLFVFNDFQLAMDFACDAFGWEVEIWSCEITNPSPISRLSRFGRELFHDYWEVGMPSDINTINVPEGSVAVDSVKLIERMRRL